MVGLVVAVLSVGGGLALAHASPVHEPALTTAAAIAAHGDPYTLVSPKPQVSGFFGYSVAQSGTTIAVGAPTQNSTSQAYGGLVYVFKSTTGALVQTLASPIAQWHDYFGFSVAVAGKFVVVGAPLTNVSGLTYSGAAYIFSTSGTLLTTLVCPSPQVGAEFGYSVAISGTTVAVGAPGENVSGQPFAGHVYLFRTSGALLGTFTSPEAEYYGEATPGEFGFSVGLGGSTLVVGAPGEDAPGAVDAGHAYLYKATTGALLATLTSPNAQYDGLFGWSVALSGKTVVVSAQKENASGFYAPGRAYLFSAPGGTLVATLVSGNPIDLGGFGYSVSVEGSTVLVGAPFETAGTDASAGHAYTFTVTGASVAVLTSPNAQAGGWFGTGVAVAPHDVVVGAPNEEASGYVDGGHAYEM